jgi:hypothetical protein
MSKQLTELIEWMEGQRKNLDDPMYSGYILNLAYKRIIEKAKQLQQAEHEANKDKPTEPNQTEAPKETIEALPEKVLEKYFPNPDDLVNGRVKNVIIKAMEEYASLARKQVIEEIEEWVKANFFTLGGDQEYIDIKDLLTKLQTLKP